MTKMFLTAAAAIGVALSCPAAQAADHPFGAATAVDNASLAQSYGTYRPPVFTLTVGQMKAMQDAIARDDFRVTGSIGAVVMDNWWFDRAADAVPAR
ncbi:hypothetical protein [Sphingomonas sp. RS2018]